MQAKEFFNKLKVTLNDLQVLEYYYDNTKWTKVIKKICEDILGDKEYVSNEYYRIDSLKYDYTEYYLKDETFHKKKFGVSKEYYLNLYNWKNTVAIEYENDCHSWTDELIKLSHIRCDLKVIVTYSEWTDNDDTYIKLIEEKLVFAKELLENCEKEALKDNWLIVFGPCKVGTKFDGDIARRFVGYKMNNETCGFERL